MGRKLVILVWVLIFTAPTISVAQDVVLKAGIADNFAPPPEEAMQKSAPLPGTYELQVRERAVVPDEGAALRDCVSAGFAVILAGAPCVDGLTDFDHRFDSSDDHSNRPGKDTSGGPQPSK